MQPQNASRQLVPGSVVRLKEPYPVSDHHSLPLLKLGVQTPWRWEGFTHGIVAEVLSRTATGQEKVSLFLYHPELKIIYLNPHTGLPIHVDYQADEVEVIESVNAGQPM